MRSAEQRAGCRHARLHKSVVCKQVQILRAGALWWRRAARRRGAESSDDEEHFAKKEAARLARDKARLAPVTLGGRGAASGPWGSLGLRERPAAAAAQPQQPEGEGGVGLLRPPGGAAGLPPAAPPQPLAPEVAAGTDFSCVAGLEGVVAQLREMVLLPLMYPGLFERMGITPPRWVGGWVGGWAHFKWQERGCSFVQGGGAGWGHAIGWQWAVGASRLCPCSSASLHSRAT